MKKTILTFIVFAFFVNVFAQIKVNSSGQVGMGCDPSSSACWIKSTTTPNFVLEGVSSRLQIGVAPTNGAYASFAQTTDVVYRPLGGAHHGLIFILPNNLNDGNSYIKFGDGTNGGWFSILNNKTAVINGNVGIGKAPVIIEALKDQRLEIERQREQINELKGSSLRSVTNETGTTGMIDPVMAQCKLYQNTPNPFNQETEIKYYLPQEIKTAYLCIYNLQGTQIKQIKITQRGEDSQWISGSELAAGMYLDALIVDGKEVDTKRMILTK